jgi:hypothetical protein
MSAESIAKIVEALRDVPEDRQQQLLDYVNFLRPAPVPDLSEGTNGLESCFGILSSEDGAQMEKVIADAFERIDWDEWPNLSRH